MNTLVLERFNYGPDGTFGTLVLPSGLMLYTVEKPWEGNRPFESCIPEGIYPLGLRESPVVKRTSRGKYSEGWEVQDVPDREFIMLHPANWPFDVEGCIGPGFGYQVIQDRMGKHRNAVTQSQDAFVKLMEDLSRSSYWTLEIIPKLIQYP